MLAGLISTFVAAAQASLSVLLVISYGGLAARLGLLYSDDSKVISKISVKLFLPALLFVAIGSDLGPTSAHCYLIVLVWALVCHAVSFLIGVGARFVFGFPDWITAAIMFNNTTSYPLLLIQSLEATDNLSNLIQGDESIQDAIERAKSYFLVFATVSSCLTFAIGPRLADSEHELEPEDLHPEEDPNDDRDRRVEGRGSSEFDGESQPLLPESRFIQSRGRQGSILSITFFPAPPEYLQDRRRAWHISRPRWDAMHPQTQWWLLFFSDFLNAPLIGALLGVLAGFITPFHQAFFADPADGGIFTVWLTESWKIIGRIFIPLRLIMAGVSVYQSYHETRQHSLWHGGRSRVPWLTTLFVLVMRFAVWPMISISIIWAVARHSSVLGNDPMMLFAMMLMPIGPLAMRLIMMVQVSNAGEEDERQIAQIFALSYAVSPIIAFSIAGALKTAQHAFPQ